MRAKSLKSSIFSVSLSLSLSLESCGIDQILPPKQDILASSVGDNNNKSWGIEITQDSRAVGVQHHLRWYTGLSQGVN
jgi:predicted phage tail protein